MRGNDGTTTPDPMRPRGRTVGLGVFIAGLMVGMIVAAFGVAGAQPTAAVNDLPAVLAQDDGGEDGAKATPRKRLRGHGIHGEFTARDGEGGYRRIATQYGEVTAVSTTSITVKSEDGFTRTYVVNGDTKIFSENKTIADITVGEKVRIAGVVDGDTVTAKKIADGSGKRADLRKQRREQRQQDSASDAPSASTTAV